MEAEKQNTDRKTAEDSFHNPQQQRVVRPEQINKHDGSHNLVANVGSAHGFLGSYGTKMVCSSCEEYTIEQLDLDVCSLVNVEELGFKA